MTPDVAPRRSETTPVRTTASNERATQRPRPGSGAFDLLLIVLLACALRIPTMHLSVAGDPDESSFILAGRELTQGHLPYVTYWDHKPLGSTVLIAAAMTAFGQSVVAVRALGLASVIATGWLLYFSARRVAPGRVAPLAAGLLYVAFSDRLVGASTMTEVLLAPYTACGVLLLLTLPERRGTASLAATFAVAGLSFGIATWIKYVPSIPATLAGIVALIRLLRRPEGGLRRTIGFGALFVLGLLFATLVSICVYWLRGDLDVFLDANISFAGRYTGGMQDDPRGAIFFAISQSTRVAGEIWPLLLLALGTIFPTGRAYLFREGTSYAGALLFAWTAGETLSVAAQTKFYVSQYPLLLPPLSLLSAIAIGAYARNLARPRHVERVAALTTLLVAIGPCVATLRETVAEVSHGDVPRQIAKLIDAEAHPGDATFVANYEPIIYFLARAPLPTRYAYSAALIGAHEAVIPIDAHAEIRRILDTRPKFIVLNKSWRDDPVYWDPDMMLLLEQTVARGYVQRADWKLAASKGTVALFVRSD